MHAYQLALFVHLLALLAAIAASALVHYSLLRLRRAETAAEALPLIGTCHRVSPAFPIALLALVATGAWMVHSAWSWSAGFVDAGLVGAAFLFASGAVLEGGRAKNIAAALAGGAHPSDVVHDPVLWAANSGNTGLALAIVFVMATKPSAPIAFVALAVGLAIGAGVGLALRRPTAPVGEQVAA